MKQLIYVLGDVHAEFAALNSFINREIRMNSDVRAMANALAASGEELEILFLQCGDFGYFWPGEDNSVAIKNRVGFAKDGHIKIYWTDGNHEDHDALDELEQQHPGESFIEVAPGVFFATFGAVLTLADGSNVLFAGGAESCDAADRTPGESWWAQEGIDLIDMEKLPPADTKIDLVISHTGPLGFQHMGLYFTEKKLEQSRKRLQVILDTFHPSKWYFGHFHDYYRANEQGCEWTCLNFLGSGDTWYDCIQWPDVAQKPQKVMIVGDTHGVFNLLKSLVRRHNPSLVLQVGDFGYWPNHGMRLPKLGFRDIADNVVPVHFCDGNHENHWRLMDIVSNGKDLELSWGVFYQPRGSVLTLPDGRTVLFAGGAASIDRDMRTPGIDWFPQEIFTDEEFRTLFPDVETVDIVISHTAPESVTLPPRLDKTFYDPSRRVLELVLHRYKPKLWFCGHFHIAFTQKLLGGECTFMALGCAGEYGGTAFLDDFNF